ncbi:MAG: Fic family protein [Acidimicrobiales bacterium]
MKRPSLALVVAINRAVREADEWFDDEPDDLPRVKAVLVAAQAVQDPVVAAATLAFRLTRAQAFAEGNKRTALLVARWVLDHNGIDGAQVLPPDDRVLADLLVKAAMGVDVGREILDLFVSRS